MLKITLTLTLTLTYTRPPMFDRLQRRNNSHTVKTNHAKVVLLICPDNPTGAIALSFGQRDDDADAIYTCQILFQSVYRVSEF